MTTIPRHIYKINYIVNIKENRMVMKKNRDIKDNSRHSNKGIRAEIDEMLPSTGMIVC